jgi:lysophospholipase L1-like esterase
VFAGVLAGLLFCLASCQAIPAAPQTALSPCIAPNSTTHTLLALGDSYTIGQGVHSAERWYEQLITRLRAEGWNFDTPIVLAHTGWTTHDLAVEMANSILPNRFDLVTLSIGVNNQYRGESATDYRTDFAQLLERAIALTGGIPDRVLVLSIPDWSVTPFAQQAQSRGVQPQQVASEIDAFNAVNRALATDAGTTYIDITPISRQRTDPQRYFVSDGLHPNGALYSEWTDLALPAACAALQP